MPVHVNRSMCLPASEYFASAQEKTGIAIRRCRRRDRESDPMKKAHLQSMFVGLQRLFVGLRSLFERPHSAFAGSHSPLAPLHPLRAAVQRAHVAPHTASAALRMPFAAAHLPVEALHAAVAGRQTSIVGVQSPVLPSISWYADRISPRVGAHAEWNVSQTPRCGLQITLVHPITHLTRRKRCLDSQETSRSSQRWRW